MRCVKLTRMLRDQQSDEEEKCLTYYCWLAMEIEHQQRQAIGLIESVYTSAIKQIEEASVDLDKQYREGGLLLAPELELELMRVEVDEWLRPKIHDQL